MINTEHGRLDELIEMVGKDREYVLEALGMGPSGPRVWDKTLVVNDDRRTRFERRAKGLTDILNILWSLKK
jgi:hypothetical protein